MASAMPLASKVSTFRVEAIVSEAEGIRRLVWVLGFKVWAVGFRVYRLIAPKCLQGFKCIGFGV